MIQLRAASPLHFTHAAIVPIEAIYHDCRIARHSFDITALKEPFAVIIVTAAGIRALDTAADEIGAGPLIAGIPGLQPLLDALLEQYRRPSP